MSKQIFNWSARLAKVLASRRFGWLVLAWFVIQAVWFAFSARYPMAFDENYHYGLIKLHAQQPLPFFTHTPPDSGQFGAIVRDPSYLYQWLMSLPYRLLNLAHHQVFAIISLRLINIALFTWGLLLMRRLMARLKLSASFINGATLVFILLPVVPFLAATINYDNLFFVAVAASLLLAHDILAGFEQQRWAVGKILVLAGILMLGCLVKYPFLPLPTVMVPFLIWRAWRSGLFSRRGLKAAGAGWRRLSLFWRLVAVLSLLVSLGLFTERYGLNLIRYHDPVPVCNQVISESECQKYGPYQRDSWLASIKPVNFNRHLHQYLGSWLYGMWYRLLFSVGWNYESSSPLPLMGAVTILVAAVCVMLILLKPLMIMRRPILLLIALVIMAYLVALFVEEYGEYGRTAQPVAINGRYLVPFLLPVAALAGTAAARLPLSRGFKQISATLIIVTMLTQGGGMMSFVIQGRDNWLWNNPVVIQGRWAIRDVVAPLALGKGVVFTSP